MSVVLRADDEPAKCDLARYIMIRRLPSHNRHATYAISQYLAGGG